MQTAKTRQAAQAALLSFHDAYSDRGEPDHHLAVIDDSESLPAALVKLSEATQEAYNIALDANRTEVATELRVLGQQVATLLAKSLRGDLGRVS